MEVHTRTVLNTRALTAERPGLLNVQLHLVGRLRDRHIVVEEIPAGRGVEAQERRVLARFAPLISEACHILASRLEDPAPIEPRGANIALLGGAHVQKVGVARPEFDRPDPSAR